MPRTAASAASRTSSRRRSNSSYADAVGRRPQAQAGVSGLAQQAARAPVVVAPERLVEATDALQAEQVGKRDEVQADLQTRLVEPLRPEAGAVLPL